MTANLPAVVWDGDDVLVYVPAPHEFELALPDADRPVVVDDEGYEVAL